MLDVGWEHALRYIRPPNSLFQVRRQRLLSSLLDLRKALKCKQLVSGAPRLLTSRQPPLLQLAVCHVRAIHAVRQLKSSARDLCACLQPTMAELLTPEPTSLVKLTLWSFTESAPASQPVGQVRPDQQLSCPAVRRQACLPNAHKEHSTACTCQQGRLSGVYLFTPAR